MVAEARWDVPDLNDYDGEFEDYYDRPPSEDDLKFAEKNDNFYYGRNVAWIGDNGRMLRVPASELTPREDNIFDFDKMAAVKKHIENSEEQVIFEAPIAQIVVVDFNLIEDTQKSYYSGGFETDYNINEPFSLGDEDLDMYVGNPEKWNDENCIPSYDDVLLFEKDPKEWIKDWSMDEDPSEWTEDEKEDYESMLEAIEQHKNVRNEIKEAVENEDGDIGEYWVDLRDGNHRAFGAIASGEPFVWVIAITDRTDSSVELQ